MDEDGALQALSFHIGPLGIGGTVITTWLLMAVLGVASLGIVQSVIPQAERIGFNGWFVWLVLIFVVVGPFHPPALDDVTRLDFRRRLVGYAVIVIFILTFVPVPMRLLG